MPRINSSDPAGKAIRFARGPVPVRLRSGKEFEMTDPFVPTLYVKVGCPFSLKVRLFLLEAGLLGGVKVVEGATPEEHRALADMLAARLGKASFPTVEIAPGEFMAESDILIDHFAGQAAVDPADLPTYQAYAASIFPNYLQLYRENAELRRKAA